MKGKGDESSNGSGASSSSSSSSSNGDGRSNNTSKNNKQNAANADLKQELVESRRTSARGHYYPAASPDAQLIF